MNNEAGPLDGVRIMDLSTTFMAPYATSVLARMGAEVIKVEAPGGDVLRNVMRGRSPQMGPVFINGNTGKRSVVLNLQTEEGQEALLRVAETVDVFVHNIRPKAAARLRIDAATVLARNPRCIHATFSGFGDGPYADNAAYDDVIQGISGVAAVQGGSGDPSYVATTIADKTVGLAGAIAILGALWRRQSTGVGESVLIPMFEFMADYILLENQSGWVFDPPIGDTGYPRTASPYRRPYRTLNGFLSVLIYTDAQWLRFFDLIGRPELAASERFATIGSRTEHVDELYSMLADVLLTRTTDEWLTALNEASIAGMKINSIEDLFSDEHLAAAEFFRTVDHPSEGRLKLARFPIKFGGGAAQDLAPAPRLGQHTREILMESGLTVDEVSKLLEIGAAIDERDR